jgi:hypothetical protein
MKTLVVALVLLSISATLTGCGGGHGGGGGTPAISIPSSTRQVVDAGGTVALNPTVTGLGASPTFSWTLSAPAAQTASAISPKRLAQPAATAACSPLGTLNPANTMNSTYTPPPLANIPSSGCSVTAKVSATGNGATVNASFTISVTGPISVAMSGPISNGGSVQAASSAVTFNATVTNDENNMGVSWSFGIGDCSVPVNACGTLTNATTTSVTYTPPQNPPSPNPGVVVIAMSNASYNLDCSKANTCAAQTQVGFTVKPAPITLAFSPNPPFTAVNAGGPAQNFTVNMTHDITGQGAAFTLTCSTSECGTLPNHPPQSGTAPNTVQPGTYTPPATQTATSATITATAIGGSHPSISFTFAINPPTAALTVTTTTLPNGTENVSYSQQVAATGGVTPYKWSLASGTLPTGLSLSTAGVISGTPTASGNFSFTVEVADAESPPQTATQPLGITINSPTSGLNITTTSPLPGATLNSAYTTPVTATGGTPPYTWTLGTGSVLPAGLSLTSGSPSATISGTPTATGTFKFTLDVKDSASSPATASASFLVTVTGSSTFTCPTPFNPLQSLCGTNFFELEGSRSNGAKTMHAAMLVIDDSGNVVSGEEYDNDTASGYAARTITGGSYVMDTSGDGRGVLTITDSTAAATTFRFVNHTAANYKPGPIEVFDSSGVLASGIFVGLPTTGLPQIPANTVVGAALTGVNGAGQTVGLLGNFEVGSNGCDGSPGSFNSQTGETIVTNSGGTVTTGMTATGSCTAADANGVGTAQITLSGGTPFTNNTLNFRYFEYTESGILDLAVFESTDTIGTNQPILGGGVLRNPSPGQVTSALFASTCGGGFACVVAEGGSTSGGGPIRALVRFIATAGSGNTGTVSGVLDENAAGTITTNGNWPYTSYTIDANGVGTFTGSGKTIHFVTTDKGFSTLDESAQVRTGSFDQQNSVTIENVGSPYVFGGGTGSSTASTLFAGFVTPTGTTTSGTLPGTVDVISSAGLFPGATASGTYTSMNSTTGRGTGTANFTNGSTVNTVIYVSRHRKFVVLDVQSTKPYLTTGDLQ